jgi:carboxymethylenebutenolidase
MCFDYDAHPPIQPVAGAAFSTERLTLTAGDGNVFLAYAATAGIPGNPGIVILPDVRGLFAFYEELADRFAERGFDAVAIDYFGRTAGTSARDEQFDFWPHVQQTTLAGVTADTAAAAALLRRGAGNESRPLFTIGFCFGGSGSWLQAIGDHGLAGAIGFYGRPTDAWEGFEAPAAVADRFDCPVLGLFGGADQSIPPEAIAAFDAALVAGGIDHEFHTYEGAPHSFFDRAAAEYSAASVDAWERILGFIAAHTG